MVFAGHHDLFTRLTEEFLHTAIHPPCKHLDATPKGECTLIVLVSKLEYMYLVLDAPLHM